jgi:hypothetical protein
MVTDAEGVSIERATVTLEQPSPGGRTVASKVVTDAAGRFQTGPLSGGVYLASAPGGAAIVRLWKGDVAPPSASNGLLIVSDEQTARGQTSTAVVYEFLAERPALTYAGIAAAIVIPVVEIADDQDERKRGS